MHYKRDILTVILLNFFLASTVLGAIPAWDRTFGGKSNDSAVSVVQNSNGEYVIAGTTSSYGAGGSDAWLIITDSKGNWLWDRPFGGKGNDSAASVIQTSDGGYAIAGTTASYSAGGTAAWLIKTDPEGNWSWDKLFGGKKNDSAASVIQTSDGGYVIAGITTSYGTGGSAVWLIKTDAKGNRLWDRTFGGTGNDSAASVIQTSDGGYAIAGTTASYGAGGSDVWLIKTDPEGNWSWDKPFGGMKNDSATSLIQTSDGGYVIAGTTSSYSVGGSDVWLIRTDSNGTRLWDKTFGGTGDDSAASVMQTSDGEYAIVGTTASYSSGGSAAWLLYVLDNTTSARKSSNAPSFISTNKSLIIAVLVLLASLFIISRLRNYKL